MHALFDRASRPTRTFRKLLDSHGIGMGLVFYQASTYLGQHTEIR